MNLVEIWVFLKNKYDEHCYNGRQLTQLQRQFPKITPNIDEA